MKKNILTLQHVGRTKGFTLVEALISAFVVSSVVLGPLTVAINASSHARLTKDIIIATYLAQEPVELLRQQQDSIYTRCIQDTGTFCMLQNNETPSDAGWRLFRARLGSVNGGTSCYTIDNPNGCAFDFIDMTEDLDLEPSKYIANSSSCNQLSLGPDYTFVCTGVHGTGPGYVKSKYTRVVQISSLQTFSGPDADYNDDLRVTSKVSFRRPSGFMRDIIITDFLHARS